MNKHVTKDFTATVAKHGSPFYVSQENIDANDSFFTNFDWLFKHKCSGLPDNIPEGLKYDALMFLLFIPKYGESKLLQFLFERNEELKGNYEKLIGQNSSLSIPAEIRSKLDSIFEIQRELFEGPYATDIYLGAKLVNEYETKGLTKLRSLGGRKTAQLSKEFAEKNTLRIHQLATEAINSGLNKRKIASHIYNLTPFGRTTIYNALKSHPSHLWN